jgi:hypothetical protein
MTARPFLFIFSLLLSCCPGLVLSLNAQELSARDSLSSASMGSMTEEDTTMLVDQFQDLGNEMVADTIPPKKLLSGVELKIDYGKLLLIWSDFETKYEAGLNFRFYERIVLATEFGGAELNPLKAYDNTLYYTISGMYGRVGLDYYTAYDPGNFYYVGIRYGMSNFEDEGIFLLESDFWEDYQEGFGSKDVTASWAEFVLGTETFLKVGKRAKKTGKSRLLLGWNARLRFLTDFENREEPRIYAIPGYGRTFNNVAAALNFYIKYRMGS